MENGMSDYISREEALNAMLEFAEFYSCEIHNAEECVIEYMNAIPAADVRPVVRGKWDTHDVVKVLASGKCLDGFCQCEKCGGVFPIHYAEYIFCPNCGADMREGNHE